MNISDLLQLKKLVFIRNRVSLFIFLSILFCQPPLANGKLDEVASLQIALDNSGFSPGIIDGHSGPKTSLAIQYARQAGQSFEVSDSNSWIIWKIPSGFTQEIGALPESWLERSKLKKMTFETVREKIAEQFHVSEEYLQTLNPKIKDWSILHEGDSIKAPLLYPKHLPLADHLRVSLLNKVIVALDAQDHPLASFPCSIAARKEKRPAGKLEVYNLAPNPDYLFDPKLFPDVPESAHMKSKLMIPSGPNNPVGEMWIGLSLKGYGIHGTPHPEDIGKTESHGCFRLTNWDVKRLATMIRIGTPVWVEKN